ncbi:hypothetical protein TNCV_1788401 [Trichonephila clavipes]|nr:hypothetical protein TNCV_1788401 [Trichonephila clavipes]
MNSHPCITAHLTPLKKSFHSTMPQKETLGRSQPRVEKWFCIAVAECGLALSSNSRTPDLKSTGHFFQIHLLGRGRPLPVSVYLRLARSLAISSFAHNR